MDARPKSPKMKLLITALLLICATGASLTPARAQEESETKPVVREGQWVDLSIGTDIDPETPKVVGEAVSFPSAAEKVYCFTRVHGMRPPASVTHVWYHEGRTISRVDLNIGSENWRTWSFKSRFDGWSGAWEVKVLNEDGMVLGSATFDVQ
jgi:hypothetical protein